MSLKRMRLELKNFGCHESLSVSFADGATTLIHGNSGRGKTTILNALFFAITGSGNKVITNGKTSCSVMLEFNWNGSLNKIIRTKRPNRLTFTTPSETVESDDAQARIDAIFGAHVFYLQQNIQNSFIMLSPLEKVKFLETFLFHDVNIGDIKSTLKNIIKKEELHLSDIQGQISMAKSILKTATGNVTINDCDIDQLKIQTAVELKESSSLITETQQKLEKLCKAEALMECAKQKLASCVDQLQKESDDSTEDSDRSVTLWSNTLRKLKIQKEIEDETKYFQTQYAAKLQELTREHSTLSKMDLVESLEKLVLYVILRNEHEDTFDCPVCMSRLKFEGESLVPASSKQTDCRLEQIEKYFESKNLNVSDHSVKKLEKYKEVLQKNLTRLRDIEDVLNITNEDTKKQRVVGDLYEKMRLTMTTKTNEVGKIKDVIDTPGLTISSVQRTLTQLNDRIQQRKVLAMQHECARRDIQKCTECLSEFKGVTDGELREALQAHQTRRDDLMQKTRDLDDMARSRELQAKLAALQAAEEVAQNRYNASLILKSKVLQAETMAMKGAIDVFNTHMRVYLDQFFEEPFSAQIEFNHDDKKSTKYQFQTNINNNGNLIEASQLSGGEMNRLVVASTLALCEIINSPLVMLDESINNLDMTTAGMVIQALNNLSNKTVLLISHQAVGGVFTHQYELKK